MVYIYFHNSWNNCIFPLNNIKNTSTFYKYNFNGNNLGNSFLSPTNFGNCSSFINGYNLGGFLTLGSIHNLCIPIYNCKKDTNKIIDFQSEGIFTPLIKLSNKPLYMK